MWTKVSASEEAGMGARAGNAQAGSGQSEYLCDVEMQGPHGFRGGVMGVEPDSKAILSALMPALNAASVGAGAAADGGSSVPDIDA